VPSTTIVRSRDSGRQADPAFHTKIARARWPEAASTPDVAAKFYGPNIDRSASTSRMSGCPAPAPVCGGGGITGHQRRQLRRELGGVRSQLRKPRSAIGFGKIEHAIEQRRHHAPAVAIQKGHPIIP
jgi:hypothetical protein